MPYVHIYMHVHAHVTQQEIIWIQNNCLCLLSLNHELSWNVETEMLNTKCKKRDVMINNYDNNKHMHLLYITCWIHLFTNICIVDHKLKWLVLLYRSDVHIHMCRMARNERHFSRRKNR